MLHDMLDAQLFPRPQRVPRRKPARNAGHFYGLLRAGINTSASCGRARFATPADHIPSGFATTRDRPSETVNNTKPPSKLRISNVRHADGFRLIAFDKHVRDGMGAS